MTLSFLPWPIFVLIMLSGSTILAILAIKYVNEYPKTLISSLILLSIFGLLIGAFRICSDIPGLEQYEPLFFKLAMLCFIPTIPLLLIGCYIKEKDDPEKKKIIQICVAATLFILAFMTAIVLSSI